MAFEHSDHLNATARQRLHASRANCNYVGLDSAVARTAGADHRHSADVSVGSAGLRLPGVGIGAAAGGDEVFRLLVLARIIEATSKLNAARC